MPDELIIGATNPTYLLVAEDVGRMVYCRVRATNVAGSADALSVSVGPIATGAPPINAIAPSIADITPEVSEILYCNLGSWTSGAATPVFSYQWKRDATNVGTNSENYTVVVGDVGANLSCTVTATDAFGATSADSNSVGPVVAGSAPVNTAQPLVTADADPAVGETIICGTGTWTGTPTIIYGYQWRRYPSGDPLPGASNTASYVLQATDAGLFVFCRVTATNGMGSATADSNVLGAILGAGPVPVNTTAPHISETSPGVPEVLTCTSGFWSGATPIIFSYQWVNSASGNISGAESPSYTITSTDIGDNVFCKVTATNAYGSAFANSNTVGPVGAVPINTVAPVLGLSGADTEVNGGDTLTCPLGTWTGSATIVYESQWCYALIDSVTDEVVLDDDGNPVGTPIEGETDTTYEVVP